MRRILLLLILLSSISANAIQVQIDFVNGFSIGLSDANPLSLSIGTSTTNSEINTILSNHNVNLCVNTFHSPYDIMVVEYNGSALNNFKNELLSNSNVSTVRTGVNVTGGTYYFADRLYLELSNAINGNPIGTNNGTITTSNSALNAIFTSYNVTSMTVFLTSIPVYIIYFEGNMVDLKTELENLSSVVETTEFVSIGLLLDNSEFNISKTIISPNPFSTNFNIKTDELISNYTLFDVTGKQLINTTSKEKLDNLSSQLHQGIYVLGITLENGQKATYKLVKE